MTPDRPCSDYKTLAATSNDFEVVLIKFVVTFVHGGVLNLVFREYSLWRLGFGCSLSARFPSCQGSLFYF